MPRCDWYCGLHLQHAVMVRDGAGEDRLNVESLIKEELAGAEGIGLIADQDRDDGCCSAPAIYSPRSGMFEWPNARHVSFTCERSGRIRLERRMSITVEMASRWGWRATTGPPKT